MRTDRKPPLLPSLPAGQPLPDAGSEEWPLLREPLNDVDWIQTLAYLEARCRKAMLHLGTTLGAAKIREDFQWLDAVMTDYCQITCPACADPCCHAGKVFYNLADLLFQMALDLPFPAGQTRTEHSLSCRFLTVSGCTLPRPNRPYVCVWYLCDPQMQLLERESPPKQRRFTAALQSIRNFRLELQRAAARLLVKPLMDS